MSPAGWLLVALCAVGAACGRSEVSLPPMPAPISATAQTEMREALAALRAAPPEDEVALAAATRRARAALDVLEGEARIAAHDELIAILSVSRETRDVPTP